MLSRCNASGCGHVISFAKFAGWIEMIAYLLVLFVGSLTPSGETRLITVPGIESLEACHDLAERIVREANLLQRPLAIEDARPTAWMHHSCTQYRMARP
jgi:hypothetical protein